MKKLRLACAQISSGGGIRENIGKSLMFIDRAVAAFKPDIIVFPESATTGFNHKMKRSEVINAFKNPDNFLAPVLAAAKTNRTYILYPSYETAKNKKDIFNSAFLIDPKGKISAVYRKTHLFPSERIENGGMITPGDSVCVTDTPWGRTGIMICFDGDFPVLSMKMADAGAEVILRPSAFLRSYEIWKLTNQARAFDNHVFVAGVNQCGTDPKGTLYYGNSMIVSPTGQVLAHARGIEEIICADLEPAELQKITYGSKEKRKYDHLKDRNKNI